MILLPKKVGGFFALHEPDCGLPKESILFRWTNGRAFTAFSLARSAFAALVDKISPRAVWLPAYTCGSLIAASWQERARYYRLREGFEPDVASLERDVVPGDMVLAVDFFGFPPGPGLMQFVRRRRDLLYVENRAHALDPGVEPWADWTLYSPRKLLGVADGEIAGCRKVLDAKYHSQWKGQTQSPYGRHHFYATRTGPRQTIRLGTRLISW